LLLLSFLLLLVYCSGLFTPQISQALK